MAEINIGKHPKVIAFYLPQFHTIPENDLWWGKGFTEWTNVKRALPMFNGHDQPKVPLDYNYYDLTNDAVKLWQAEIAHKHNVFGFCYYHYWFKKGKMLLEKPAEQMLANKAIDQPFCFCWANENWSKNWDGGNQEIIVRQDYGGKSDWKKHIDYLLPFFLDSRYITVDGKPLFIIYKPEQIIDIVPMMRYFKKRVLKAGLPGLCLAFQYPNYYSDMYYRPDVFDYQIAFEPAYSRDKGAQRVPGTDERINRIRHYFGEFPISLYRKSKQIKLGSGRGRSKQLSRPSYIEVWNTILTNKWTHELLPGAFVDWDNTPRNRKGTAFEGFTPEVFADYFTKLVKRARSEEKPMIFINAWNEWAEGAFLEPDEKYGYAKLEAIKNALEQVDNS